MQHVRLCRGAEVAPGSSENEEEIEINTQLKYDVEQIKDSTVMERFYCDNTFKLL